MLVQHGRIVFATTVHGYEGTGRGFEVRFRAVLDRITPGWRALRLSTPIRWAEDDPLERLIAQALLLDAEPAPDEPSRRNQRPMRSRRNCFEALDRDRLAADEPLLRQVFGLLVLGHYQTRPADLRHLLDGPNMGVSILRSGDTLLATALTAREGALPEDLLAPIFEGRRRPRGHLLPQTLSAHAGLFDAPRLGFMRIVRIACTPPRGDGGLACT
jgi:tRNA(Met) cytidine acetyltransferase